MITKLFIFAKKQKYLQESRLVCLAVICRMLLNLGFKCPSGYKNTEKRCVDHNFFLKHHVAASKMWPEENDDNSYSDAAGEGWRQCSRLSIN